MLLLVDGADCVAKSTLVHRLVDAITAREADGRLDVRHAGPPTSHPLDEYETPLLDYRPGTGRHVVCDRWHLGEAVYPAVFGRPTKFDDAVRLHVDLFLRSRGALVVVVTARATRVQQCIEERGDDLVTSDMVHAIQSGFTDALRMSLVPFVVVNGYEVTDDDVRLIIERADAEARGAARLNQFTTYVGPARPATLLLGDVRHGSDGDPGDLRPAFMPYPATSGHYALGEVARRWPITALAGLGIANACDVDDPVELRAALGDPVTVTLGRNAQRRLPGMARELPHPQWVRRFQHRSGDAYAAMLLGEPIPDVYSQVELTLP